MILAGVIAVFAVVLGASFYGKAKQANRNALQWGLGVGIGIFVVSWVAVLLVGAIFGALGTPFFGQVAAQLIAAWIIVVLIGGAVCDRLAERLPA